ncbi:hypothetical protein OG280_24320 [Streptomyces virginiae]|uniref:hypothetical protein n=1 Tax=Streptomyces virginiae TaxID=1961 RepID=UPI002DD7F7A3|nr:hypothetical protein [Streptomyces virginiae]WSC77854.1 hypothetical protein OHA56_16810 [Streptomyces virginiae]
MKQLVPYPTLRRSDGLTTIEVREGRVDEDALPLELVNRQERRVAVHGVGYADWSTARLAVRMRVPAVADADAEGRGWRDVRAAVTIANRTSNVRSVTPLRQDASGDWIGEVRVDRDEHLGRLQLTGIVTATVDGVPGRLIGSAEDAWTVDVDARTAHREQDIRMTEVDFGSDEHPHLHDFRHNEWAIDANGAVPTVYVNTALEGVARLLGAPARGMSPAESALQKALAAKLGTDLWVTLFHSAADEVFAEDGEPQWPGGWRDNVLKRMLPDVCPDLSPSDALRELLSRRVGGAGRDLHMRVLHAAGRQSRSARSLGEALRDITKGSAKQ